MHIVLDALDDFLKAIGIAAPHQLGWVMVVLAFIIALVAAWRFIPHVRIFSLRMGWADEPNSRRLNEEPLPNAGGLAIFAAVIVALVIAILFHSIGLKSVLVQILAILLGGSFMIIAGFIDDQFHLPPIFRLLVQVFATLLLIASGVKIDIHATSGFFHNPGLGANLLLDLLTILWIVGITNAFNLIDGVDGLAGGVAFITSMSLLSVAAQFEDRGAAVLLMAALGGAALGFLRHNFPPSRIIMGDSGAYFFGFVIAASSLLGSLKTTTIFALFPTLLFLLLPIVDTTQVILRRLMRRANPLSSPGKDHLHHRLLARGLSQTRTTLILWGVTLCTNILAMAIQPQMRPFKIVTTVLIISVLLGWVIWRRRRAVRRAMLLTTKPEIPEIPAGPEPIRDDYSV